MVDSAGMTGNWTLDPAHTRLGFSARHAMVTKVRGEFDNFEGTAFIDADNPAASHVEVTIQTDSISTRNEMRDPEMTRLNRSRPNESVPKKCFVLGGTNRSAKSIARGS